MSPTISRRSGKRSFSGGASKAFGERPDAHAELAAAVEDALAQISFGAQAGLGAELGLLAG
jgi:hypothetical protein